MGNVVQLRRATDRAGGQFASYRSRQDEGRMELTAAIDRGLDFSVMAETRLRESLGQVIDFRKALQQARAEVMALGGTNDAA